MTYQEPNIELIEWKLEDVITLSINNNADEIIQGPNGNNPWAQ